jgi:hypothetical protein
MKKLFLTKYITTMIGTVYKITIKGTNLLYIGSTTQKLKTRMNTHYNKNATLYPYIQHYGKENVVIEPIKTYEVLDIIHLHTYEQLWYYKMRMLNKDVEMINMINPLSFEFLHKINKLYRRKTNRIQCCGKYHNRGNYARHTHTKKHMDNIAKHRNSVSEESQTSSLPARASAQS